MTDDLITVGGLGGDEYVVALKCPDCGLQDCDVLEYDRSDEGGVIRVRCPKCEAELWPNGSVPFDYDETGRKKDTRVRLKQHQYQANAVAGMALAPRTYGEDDGE